jgi:hypothetical protein
VKIFLAFCDSDNPISTCELAIVPIGEPIHPRDIHFSEPHNFIPFPVDVLRALEFLHENEIIPRDIRWDNVPGWMTTIPL